LQLHFLNGKLQAAILLDIHVLLLYLRVRDHGLNKRCELLFLSNLGSIFVFILNEFPDWTEEHGHEIVKHVVDLNVIDAQIILGHLLIHTFHIEIAILTRGLRVLGPFLDKELHFVDADV
jgi:hypothetical protein